MKEITVVISPNGRSTVALVSEVGIPGPVGPTGPAGPPGGSGLVFSQVAPLQIWNINHNLNRFPSVTLIDTAGDEIITDYIYIDSNNIQVIFSAATAGKAYLN